MCHSLFSSVHSETQLTEFQSDVSFPAWKAKLNSDSLDALYQHELTTSELKIVIDVPDGSCIELTTISNDRDGEYCLHWRSRSLFMAGVETLLCVTRNFISDNDWQVTGRLILADGTQMLILPGGRGFAHISMMASPRKTCSQVSKPLYIMKNSSPILCH